MDQCSSPCGMAGWWDLGANVTICLVTQLAAAVHHTVPRGLCRWHWPTRRDTMAPGGAIVAAALSHRTRGYIRGDGRPAGAVEVRSRRRGPRGGAASRRFFAMEAVACAARRGPPCCRAPAPPRAPSPPPAHRPASRAARAEGWSTQPGGRCRQAAAYTYGTHASAGGCSSRRRPVLSREGASKQQTRGAAGAPNPAPRTPA